LFGHAIGQKGTSIRPVDEDGILGETPIPPEKGHVRCMRASAGATEIDLDGGGVPWARMCAKNLRSAARSFFRVPCRGRRR
jgi:hypothetical protein